jgi:hypothetical protein
MPDASTPAADWTEQLRGVEGTLVGRERRISTAELIALVGAVDLDATARDAAMKRLKQTMTALGWSGPTTMRVCSSLVKGYRRPDPTIESDKAAEPTILPDDAAPMMVGDHPAPAANGKPTSRDEELARQLERVCRLSMDKIEEILALPTDSTNGNILRAQTAVAGHAIQAQLRADESRLKVRQSSDVLERLLKIIRREKRKITRLPKQIALDAENQAA